METKLQLIILVKNGIPEASSPIEIPYLRLCLYPCLQFDKKTKHVSDSNSNIYCKITFHENMIKHC
jgi:hypothetical protein